MEKEAGFVTSEQFHPALFIAAVQSLPLPIFDSRGGDGKWLSSLEPYATSIMSYSASPSSSVFLPSALKIQFLGQLSDNMYTKRFCSLTAP